MLDKAKLNSALTALGEHLEVAGVGGLKLVVCGGSALQALGLIERTTRDVDVLALMTSEGGLDSAEPLPTAVLDAAAIVARDLSLPADWINPGPTDLLREGLPPGLVDRLHRREFGPALTVCFIDRLDQIFLKTYATVDQGGGRHFADLLALKPGKAEMLEAARWTLRMDASTAFPSLVFDFLCKTGFEDVADKLESEL